MSTGPTYRVQLHAGFDFAAAAEIVAYLERLGVGYMYTSPFLQAAPGSMHGYDVVDPHRINEELGGREGLAKLQAALREHGLGQVADIVPNHMFAGRSNRWWWDVLENGRSSGYAHYFDIDWEGATDGESQTVLAPILGDHYGKVVEAGEISIGLDGGALVVRYYDHELPLSPGTYSSILAPASERSCPELLDVGRGFDALPAGSADEGKASKEALHRRLRELCDDRPGCRQAVEAELADLNRDPQRLDDVLRQQHYRLSYWRAASDELDYRRFFNIVTLVGLRMEDEGVFEDTHRLIFDLVADGSLQGLRVDHIDGLRLPARYLERLRAKAGPTYLVVEKILAVDEALPEWPVQGTTGYEFAFRANGLFVDGRNEAALTSCYQDFTDERRDYEDVAHDAKLQVLQQELASEADRLSRILAGICANHLRHRDRTRREVHDALLVILATFPVYRCYVEPGRPVTDADRARTDDAVRRAVSRRPDVDAELFDFIGELLTMQHEGPAETEFALRFAQVCAPVMAKGVEDSAFYRYNRLVSLNEVGGSPDMFGLSPDRFHMLTAGTALAWPETMLTLSTHDTKRSADVRARINLLSEIPNSWRSAVERFYEIGDRHRAGWEDRNAEYLMYQTLIGAWPISPERMTEYMHKATREAKVHTSWIEPSTDYDDGLERFVGGLMADARFLDELHRFLAGERIAELGRVNSLSQTALLLTCPGVPDLYQGSELWDLSLVDPDNRRPVDYARRDELLTSLAAEPPSTPIADDDAGLWKLWLIRRLLAHRRHHPGYHGSAYEPLEVKGARGEHALAFRRHDLAVVAPRLVAGLSDGWQGTTVDLGTAAWTNVLTGSTHTGGEMEVGELLAACPVAVLERNGS